MIKQSTVLAAQSSHLPFIFYLHRLLILHCICHFPFVFTLHRIFRRLQVIILKKRRMSNATPQAGEDLFSTVSCNSDWQWTMELLAIRFGAPLSTFSRSCSEQLKTPSLLAGGVAFVPFVCCQHRRLSSIAWASDEDLLMSVLLKSDWEEMESSGAPRLHLGVSQSGFARNRQVYHFHHQLMQCLCQSEQVKYNGNVQRWSV